MIFSSYLSLTWSSALAVSCLRATFLNASINSDITCRLPWVTWARQVLTSSDKTVMIVEWSIIEPNLGIVCACIPVIHHPLTRFVVKVWPDELKRKKSAKYAQRSVQGSNIAPVNDSPWFLLEPYNSSLPRQISSILSRPPAHKSDEESMGSSSYIKKTTDISVSYDR